MGLITVEVVPSPKFHSTLAGMGDDVLLIATALPTQVLSGAVNIVFTVPIVTALGRMMVSLHPVLFVTISCTVKLPAAI